MRRLVLGISIGFLSAASVVLALEVALPRKTSRATVVVDQLGQVLFDQVPGKVEVTNLPSGLGAGEAWVDVDGDLVGTLATGDTPFSGRAIAVSPSGVPYEVTVGALFAFGNPEVYFAVDNCDGPPMVKSPEGSVFAKPAWGGTGTADTLLRVPRSPGSDQPVHAILRLRGPNAGCDTSPGGAPLSELSPDVEIIDVSHLQAPFRVERQ